jgi:hypothetical protein
MQTNLRAGLAILTVALGAALASTALAADKTAAGHPDFSGFWQLSGREKPSAVSKELLDALPKDVVLLDDVGAPEYPAGNFGGLKPTAKAQEIIKGWDPNNEYEPKNVCRSPSIIYSMQGPFPIEIDQADKLMVIHLEFFDMVRIVYLDGRPHVDVKQPHSLTGNSIGHWEGDTLVVDTTHLRAATLTGNGLEHSDSVHLTERFKMSPDGSTLWGTQMFEDPVMLENRGARLIAWKKVPGQHVYPYECNPFEYSKD